MSDEAVWKPLEHALARWQVAGRTPDFWLRDDDAIEPTPALDRLAELTQRFEVPLALAVIPANAGEALAKMIADTPVITPVVHGWSHQNHAPAEMKKQELGLHRPIETVLGEVSKALARTESLFGDQMAQVLVPPWNRIDRALFPHLAAIGFQAVSVFGQPKAGVAIPMINATVDIIDWHGTRGCRDYGELIGDVVKELNAGLDDANRAPIGILTHHLVHDEAAWKFLETVFEITAQENGGNWRSIHSLLSV